MKIWVRSVVAAVVVGLVAGNGLGQASAGKRPMTFQDLQALKRVSDPQISASGKWVMFSVMDVDLGKNTKVTHLWVVPIDGSKPERQITDGAGETFGRFSPDGADVSYTSGDQIHISNWNEAEGRLGKGDQTFLQQVTDVAGGADGGIWSRDSKRLMFVADVYPECSDKATWAEENACDKAKDEAADKSPVKGQVWDALLYRHWDHYTGQKRSHLLVVDLHPEMPQPATPMDLKKRTPTDEATLSKMLNAHVRDLTPRSAVGNVEVPTFFVGGVQNYAWAPDSKEIAYVAKLDPVPAASTNNDVFTLRLDEPGAKAVKVSTSPGSDDGPAYSPDGKWLAFRSQARNGFESDKFRLMLFDREKKTIKDLMPKFNNWVDEFVWAMNSKSIFFASPHRGSEPVYSVRVDGAGLELHTYLDKTLEWGEYAELRTSVDGKSLVATRTTVTEPAKIVSLRIGVDSGVNVDRFGPANTYPNGTGGVDSAIEALWKIDTLSHLNDALLSQLSFFAKDGKDAFLPLEPFEFEGADRTKVEGFIVVPPGFDRAKKYPVKFLMHGGPQTAWGDAWSYRWNWELMASSGYVVVGINRRGSTGYGQKFVDEVSGDWGGRAYEDLMRGLDYAEAHYSFIDKNRECALGASYGGYMANWVLTHTDRFKCIVTHDGMYDPVAAWGNTEEMWFNEWEFRRPEDFPKGWDGFSAGYNPLGASAGPTHRDKTAMNGAPGTKYGDSSPTAQNDNAKGVSQKQIPSGNDKPGGGHAAEPWRYQNLAADQDPFRKWAPMRFIENAKTPTLVIHSQRDYRLDVSQGFELFTALQRRGVPSKMLYFPDEGHWVLKPQNSQLWNEVVGDWCDRWTKTGKYAE